MPQMLARDNWRFAQVAPKTDHMKVDTPPEHWRPFFTHGGERIARWLILCDHAANTVPPWVGGGDLGLPPEDMGRHIAWDPGAAGVAKHLADALGAPAVFANFSRLVIDPNRGTDDPTLVMRIYDQTIIPANRHVGPADIETRIDNAYAPYNDEVARLAARQDDIVIVSVHSFTPQLRARPPRPWHIGLLFAEDDRLSRPLLRGLQCQGDVVVGENEPYSGALAGDTIDRHALQLGRQNTLIEIRNDLISRVEDQRAWAERLAPLLVTALDQADQTEKQHG